MGKTALVTGIGGQDGAWLGKLLLEKGYTVYGGGRRSSRPYDRLDELGITDQVRLVDFELSEYSNIFNVIRETKPDEVYNLAAQSFVGTSFRQPIYTTQVDAVGVSYLLDSIQTLSPGTRFYQASTSEMFGKAEEVPQRETTPFHPRSPYGVAKLYAHWLTVNYRESYNLFACSGILFNHESELRGMDFVTRKITHTVARMAKGSDAPLRLGNLEARRDWGYAPEYVEAMWRMLQADKPGTYVVATGVTTRVRDFVELAFAAIGKTVRWEGEGVDERGYDRDSRRLLVEIAPEFYRPAEVDLLLGDPSHTRETLGWSAATDVAGLVEIMVRRDLERLENG